MIGMLYTWLFSKYQFRSVLPYLHSIGELVGFQSYGVFSCIVGSCSGILRIFMIFFTPKSISLICLGMVCLFMIFFTPKSINLICLDMVCLLRMVFDEDLRNNLSLSIDLFILFIIVE